MLRRLIDRWPWTIPAALLLGLLSWGICGTACTATGKPDWPAIERELELSVADLNTLEQLAVSLEREDIAAKLGDVRDAVAQAEALLEAYNAGTGGSDDLYAVLGGALDALAALADELESDDLRFGVAAAEIVLRRIQAHFPQPQEG